MTDANLTAALKTLGLHAIADRALELISSKQDPRAWLQTLIAHESEGRQQRSLERRTLRACIGRFKTIDKFDWRWPARIDRAAIEATLSLNFIEPSRNVIFVAPPGLGKTTIAKNIAHAAILAGHTVRFTSASAMLTDLANVEGTPHLFRQRLRRYTTPDILVCDEVGYLSYASRAADLLFHVVNERHGHRPIVLTTNLAFNDWNSIFPNATCIVAMLDRLVENADIFVIEGESYRRREASAEPAATANEPPRSQKKPSGRKP